MRYQATPLGLFLCMILSKCLLFGWHAEFKSTAACPS